ncbi:thioredoxin domain-containing protein [Streptomyces sp. NBS 14/10]|uniref:DsbA family protein n=1 Tax=Streptomyces sp. NBS 14/10 TaxID=1945643 RepID=UPI000B9CDE2B|nr:thioredoxin domain-containing protein [Streptomyces sp. NBS 14/10]KAK1178466.1 thioredoxin domain-containing protein [Streptomyces sp. NBS 14/10]NUS81803.1 thioredoxin domain-containing protein [Streptomyces sp.]
MSEKNREGKRSARERLREQREKDRARAKRRRGLGVAGAVVAVLGVAAGVGMVASKSGGDSGKSGSRAVAPRGATGTVIQTGKAGAQKTLTVYEDFRCPGCKQFEDVFRKTVHQLQDKGRMKVRYHLVTIIDGNMGGTGSLYAANAAGCAQDAGKYVAYHDVLYKNQPSETKDSYADKSKLIKLAGKVPGLDTETFRRCVEEGRHDGWVRKSNGVFTRSGYSSTPTVLLDGKAIYGDPNKPLSPRKLKRMVTGKG